MLTLYLICFFEENFKMATNAVFSKDMEKPFSQQINKFSDVQYTNLNLNRNNSNSSTADFNFRKSQFAFSNDTKFKHSYMSTNIDNSTRTDRFTNRKTNNYLYITEAFKKRKYADEPKISFSTYSSTPSLHNAAFERNSYDPDWIPINQLRDPKTTLNKKERFWKKSKKKEKLQKVTLSLRKSITVHFPFYRYHSNFRDSKKIK